MNFFKDIFSNKKTSSIAICPHCKETLNEMPSRKKKCPFCKKDIYVRTSPTTKTKILATEVEAKKIDTEWEKIREKNRWLNILQSYGITEKDYEKYENELNKKFGVKPNSRDIIWRIFNELLFVKHNELQTLKMLYYEMAIFLNEEGKDFFKILQQSAIMELKYIQKQGFIKKIKIITTPNSCEACKKLDAKVLTLDEALKELPIPCKECSYIMDNGKRGFCRCLYNAEIEI
jgi:uncharacterized paraquat-inducible protein A